MQDKAGFKAALQRRFDWHTFTSDPLQDRKAFDSSCQRYDEWLANETRTHRSRVNHGKHVSTSMLPIAEGVETSGDPASRDAADASRCPLPRQLLSCEQLGRAMRVFVAWKASA